MIRSIVLSFINSFESKNLKFTIVISSCKFWNFYLFHSLGLVKNILNLHLVNDKNCGAFV